METILVVVLVNELFLVLPFGMPSSASYWVKRWLRKLSKSIMKSHHAQIPKYDLPLRFRPWFVAFTCLIMFMMGLLGFTKAARALPWNDKLLHFLCFGIATGVFYWIIDVEENARRIWFWRYSSLMFTGFTCFFCGGILSEFVQSLLPYSEFDIYDVVANLLGSSLGLSISYRLEKYYRRRREITRLYRPLNPEYSDMEDDDEELSSAFLLPTRSPHLPPQKSGKGKTVRFAETQLPVEREEIFNVGDDSDDEEVGASHPSGSNGRTTEDSSTKGAEP